METPVLTTRLPVTDDFNLREINRFDEKEKSFRYVDKTPSSSLIAVFGKGIEEKKGNIEQKMTQTNDAENK
jgi:hypothetical protein